MCQQTIICVLGCVQFHSVTTPQMQIYHLCHHRQQSETSACVLSCFFGRPLTVRTQRAQPSLFVSSAVSFWPRLSPLKTWICSWANENEFSGERSSSSQPKTDSFSALILEEMKPSEFPLWRSAISSGHWGWGHIIHTCTISTSCIKINCIALHSYTTECIFCSVTLTCNPLPLSISSSGTLNAGRSRDFFPFSSS